MLSMSLDHSIRPFFKRLMVFAENMQRCFCESLNNHFLTDIACQSIDGIDTLDKTFDK